ncbi:hypothetical protein KI387_023665, partial [Taxus chinensis]
DKRFDGIMELMSEGELKENIIRAERKPKHQHHSEDPLLKDLEETTNCLGMIKQLDKYMIRSLMFRLIEPRFFRHEDVRVRIMVINCIVEVTRIKNHSLPYSDAIMRDIFEHMFGSFQGLWNITSPYFSKRVKILETMAKVRSCVSRLDIDCDDLILHMFQVFFGVIQDNHSKNILVAMQTIMSIVLNEYENLPQHLLSIPEEEMRQETSCIDHTLAKGVMDQCSIKLKTFMVAKFSEKDMGENFQGMSFLVHNDEFLVSNACIECDCTEKLDVKTKDN